jgi:hypothetical protein
MWVETCGRLRNLPGGCGLVRKRSAVVSVPGALPPPCTPALRLLQMPRATVAPIGASAGRAERSA